MDTIEDKTMNSSFIENMIEHVFVSEMLQEAWINRNHLKLEVLRAEVDDSGYDIVMTCNNKTRYIQLKTSELGSSTRIQKMNIALLKKENACILWIIREKDDNSKRYKFKYLYFGSQIGEQFPNIDRFRIAKNARGNANGEKKERPNIRDIPKTRFKKYDSSSEIFGILFSE